MGLLMPISSPGLQEHMLKTRALGPLSLKPWANLGTNPSRTLRTRARLPLPLCQLGAQCLSSCRVGFSAPS